MKKNFLDPEFKIIAITDDVICSSEQPTPGEHELDIDVNTTGGSNGGYQQ